MKIKILEFKVNRGDKVKVQSHNNHKGNWKENKNFEMYKRLIRDSPARFSNIKEYEIEK